jgi:hypothetical protein
MHTGICEGNWRRVEVAERSPDWRHDNHGDGTEGADDDGPEVGGLLARRPAQVAHGAGPESGGYRGHCEGCVEAVSEAYVSIQKSERGWIVREVDVLNEV